MKHWYVVRESHSPSLREGDIIGFGKQNPNLTTIQDGRFVPSADWIYIGRWDVPPVDDLIEAIKLIQAKDARIKELDGMLDARSKEIVGRIQECQACQIDQLQAEGKIGPDARPRSWQITDERKAAIQMGLDYLEYAYARSGRGDIHEHAGQLRAMLEAGQ